MPLITHSWITVINLKFGLDAPYYLHAGTHKHEHIPPVLVSLLIDFKILLLFIAFKSIDDLLFLFPWPPYLFRGTGEDAGAYPSRIHS